MEPPGSRVGRLSPRWDPGSDQSEADGILIPRGGGPTSQSFRVGRGEGGGITVHNAPLRSCDSGSATKPPSECEGLRRFRSFWRVVKGIRGADGEGNCSAFRCSPLTLICNPELNFSYCLVPPSPESGGALARLSPQPPPPPRRRSAPLW